MLPSQQGAFRLFRLAGIDVFLHWSWFVVALIEIRSGRYHSPVWNVAEYLSLFLIVTLHEFGHSLACRQVGGKADRIVLWPLGGVAYVDSPQRPGATLWSIAAGPLVNVALVPVLFSLAALAPAIGVPARQGAVGLFESVAWINVGLLGFNVLPIYPLDGGQILRSLLWFVMGRARSLTVASIVGFVGVIALAGLALLARSFWIGLIAAFVATNCWSGFRHARELARVARLPRHQGYNCPSCHAAPPIGSYWGCGQCGAAFDTFQANATCPQCRTEFTVTRCVDCGAPSPIAAWSAMASAR